MLHHHDHDRPLSEAEREKLLRDGATTRGMVHHCELSPTDRLRTQVRILVHFKDSPDVEFSEELANLYQPDPSSQDGQRLTEVRKAGQLRHADRMPKIQLALSDGSMVPVRYDAANRSRLVIDVPALQKRALHDYIEQEQRQQNHKQEQDAAKPISAGPPWVVPAHCPNCGAPVDQATASRANDPLCQFCHQPIPVTPLARS